MEVTSTDTMSPIRESLHQCNVSENIKEPNINKFWKKWYNLCAEEYVNYFQPPLTFAMNFLMNIKTYAGNFGTVSNARSVTSSITFINSLPFDQNQHVCKLMKGIYNNEPPKLKYDLMWVTDIVLNFILKNGK